MISQLASPSVCVIDDEKADLDPILVALNELYVSCVHLSGAMDELPPQPFNKLRLVFLDLHLNASLGRNAASNTANVFSKVVSPDTAPIVVVIWSKYAGDKVPADGVPPEDQETEAELFKRTLLEYETKYKGRLIFVEMAKPKAEDRPGDWTEVLKTEIATALGNQSAIELLWAWDGLIKDSCAQVSQGLTLVAQSAVEGTARQLQDGLQATMQHLAKAPAEGDFSAATAPRHFLTVMTQLMVDQLEHPDGIAGVAAHGAWLSQNPPGAVAGGFPAQMNGLLLTAGVSADAGIYAPGTVFRVTNNEKFESAFGQPVSELINICCTKKSPTQRWQDWSRDARPVLIELSPACDVAQSNRVSSLLVAGLVLPATYRSDAKNKDAFGVLPNFRLRWAVDGFAEQDVVLVFYHRFKTALPAGNLPDWLSPWFRLRDLPIASIRNSNAAHAARVGFVSVE